MTLMRQDEIPNALPDCPSTTTSLRMPVLRDRALGLGKVGLRPATVFTTRRRRESQNLVEGGGFEPP